MTNLYHEFGEWLERLSEGIKLANYLSIDEMYRLGAEAEDFLLARLIVPSDEWVRAVRIGRHNKTPSRIIRLTHDHMASDVVLDIEIGAHAAPDTRFINHIDLIKAAPAKTQSLKNPLRIPVSSIPGAPK